MAISPQYIDPLNLNPNIAVGVNIPFNGPSVFTSNYTTQEAIKNNLINYFLTEPGEIPLNPTFGGGLRSFLFQQIEGGDLGNLKNDVSNKLATFFPSVNVISLDVFETQNVPNSITVNLKYSYQNTSNNILFNF
jgi:phage baseplate assembly protein W